MTPPTGGMRDTGAGSPIGGRRRRTVVMVETSRVASYCSACGHPGTQGDHFCTECGTPLLPPVQRRPLYVDEVTPAAAPAPTTQPAPQDESETDWMFEPEPPPRRRRRRGGWLVAALVLLLAAAGIGLYLGTRDQSSSDGASGGRPSTPAHTTAAPSTTASSTAPSSAASTPTEPPLQPQDQLLRISRQDDAAAARLINSWVPQLAAVTPGAGGDLSWGQALAHYQRLKRTYRNVLLLDTAEWPHSYEHGGMYAIVVPFTRPTSAGPLRWCQRHRLPAESCAAKRIATTGSWATAFDSGRPGPG